MFDSSFKSTFDFKTIYARYYCVLLIKKRLFVFVLLLFCFYLFAFVVFFCVIVSSILMNILTEKIFNRLSDLTVLNIRNGIVRYCRRYQCAVLKDTPSSVYTL